MSSEASLRTAIVDLLANRRPGTSICPSEAARAVEPGDWRALMPAARDAARRLAIEGQVEITQRGRVLPPDEPFAGPIRVRLASSGRPSPPPP